VAEGGSDITVPKTDEQSSNARLPDTALTGGDEASDERSHTISAMATVANDKGRENSDYLDDGPTIVAEVCESLHIHKPISSPGYSNFLSHK
jgi:hypothetical protein